jgi:hypothetical protein
LFRDAPFASRVILLDPQANLATPAPITSKLSTRKIVLRWP